MDDKYNKGLCEEIHGQVKEKLDLHDKRLNNHGDDIDNIKGIENRHDQQIITILKKMDDIIGQNRWFIGIVIVQLLGFFFFTIEKLIFK